MSCILNLLFWVRVAGEKEPSETGEEEGIKGKGCLAKVGVDHVLAELIPAARANGQAAG